MQNLYLVKNNFSVPSRTYEFDNTYVISMIKENYYGGKFLHFSDSHINITKTVIDPATKILLKLITVLSNQISFHSEKFTITDHLQMLSCICIELTEGSFEEWEMQVPTILRSVKIHVFANVIVVLINEDLCFRYFFYENATFGAIVDKDFIVIGFIINNINNSIVENIKSFVEQNRSNNYKNQESAFPLYNCEKTIMENKNYLIKKIIELKNVDRWKVLFYGLERQLIDNQFIMDYCLALVEQNYTDQFVLDIAGLLNKELYQITDMINARINDRDEIMIIKGQFYNKIWFYLSLASEMSAENIIE